MRIFRYAEMLLMNSSQDSKEKDGDNSYNLVRARAEMPTKSGVTLDDVLDERRIWNFCNEMVQPLIIDPGSYRKAAGNSDLKVGLKPRRTGLFHPINSSLPDLKLDPID